ncbi:MAG TPA: hypothetical protein DCY94_00840, partial [Firmicutes bacterium]|nr:hypothetical protein [Bacillota bacterium]
MKKNKKLIVVLLVMLVMMTGCTKYLSDGNKKRIINEVTGQSLTSNILCLPEDEDLLKIYSENKDNMHVDFDSLKPCAEFKPGDLKYKGLWESIFIKPLAYIIIKLGGLVKNYGLAVVILGLLIRVILFPFTKKTMLQSENMKKAQPELQRIQKKYGQATDQTQAMAMSQEMMMVYKKYNINPASGCLVSLIQIPVLFAFLEAINRVPAIFEGYFLSLQLGTSPFVGIKGGNFLYIVLIVLIVATTYFSYKYSMASTSTGNPDQDKQMEFMMKFMIIFISFASLSLPTALALYWIVTNGFVIVQNMIIKKFVLNNGKSNKNSDKKIKKA